MASGAFSTFDWSILIVYMALSLLIGVSFYRKQGNSSDFFLAGRGMSWFPIAISIMATDLSAISYMGVPALVFQKDLKYFLAIIVLSGTMVVVSVLFVPIFFRLKLFTVYEYLEGRFNVAVRSFASLLFLGGRTAWLANTIYVPALALAEITGLNVYLTILICGVVTTSYTILGGMEAVIWTDFLQFFVLIGGALVMLYAVTATFGFDIGEIWAVASAGGHTRLVDFSLDPTQEFTFWGILAGIFVYNLASYSSDQIIVQRYLTTKSLKDTARAVLGNGAMILPTMIVLYLCGVGFAAYYATHPGLAATLTSADRVLPHFTVNVLPNGLRGLILAGIFAATMSSISAGINSVATCVTKDYLTRFSLIRPESELLFGRLTSLFWGALATCSALLLVNWRLTIIEKFATIYSYFAGPLAGIFLLGVLTSRTRGWQAIAGAVTGISLVGVVSVTTDFHWLWYSPIGCGTTILTGLLLSLLSTSPARDVSRYTLAGARGRKLSEPGAV
ncbi:MAG: sodium/solute symporter [Acidobacteriota bacterium]